MLVFVMEICHTSNKLDLVANFLSNSLCCFNVVPPPTNGSSCTPQGKATIMFLSVINGSWEQFATVRKSKYALSL